CAAHQRPRRNSFARRVQMQKRADAPKAAKHAASGRDGSAPRGANTTQQIADLRLRRGMKPQAVQTYDKAK
ncbi:MAG: hypothetical protein RR100_21580, partial [Comamonas sp.]